MAKEPLRLQQQIPWFEDGDYILGQSASALHLNLPGDTVRVPLTPRQPVSRIQSKIRVHLTPLCISIASLSFVFLVIIREYRSINLVRLGRRQLILIINFRLC